MKVAASILALASLCTTVEAGEVSVVTWNVENWGESDPARIATQLRDRFDAVDLYGLVEINSDSDFALYTDYIGRDETGSYKVVAGTTGDNIRMGIFFREDRFELLDSFELTDLQFGRGRAPLVAKFRASEDGETFFFMVNHFHRGNEKKRLNQAIGVRQWAANQSDPVLLVGDYNFDLDVDTGLGNLAYDAFLSGDGIEWARPETLVTTNWSDNRPQDGVNDYNSILDFIFLANADWSYEAQIVVQQGDFPDNDYTSDHRPVVAVFTTETDETRTASNEQGLKAYVPMRETTRTQELDVFAAAPRSVDANSSPVLTANGLMQAAPPIAAMTDPAGMADITSELRSLRQAVETLEQRMPQ